MFDHLLCRRDLLNDTLTRRFRIALPWLVLSVILLLQAITPAVAISQTPPGPSSLTITGGTNVSPPPPATGKTYYVDAQPGRNCAGGAGTSYRTTQRDCGGSDGTKSWTTPQGPVSSLVAGDTILVRAGTYTATGSNHVLYASTSGTSGSRITWQAYTGETPVFSAVTGLNGGFGIYVHGGNYNTFDGIKISSGRVGMYSDSLGTEFINGEITGTYTGGVNCDYSVNCAVRRSKVYHTNLVNWPRGSCCGGGMQWMAGVGAQGASNFIAEDNYIYWNHGEGLSSGYGAQGTVFRRNVVADNWGVSIYTDGGQGLIIDSNLVYLTDTAKNWPVGAPNNNNALGIGLAVEAPGPASNGVLRDMVITNNVVVNTKSGVEAFWSGLSGIIYQDWFLAGNTFVDNDTGIVLRNVPGTITRMTVKNNIVTKSSNGQIDFNPTPTNSTFSTNIFNTTTKGTSPYFHINDVAKFYSEADSILRLTNSSTASPGLVNETAPLPRFWSDPSLSPPSPIVPFATLIAPYMPAQGSTAANMNVGARP